MKQIEDYDKIIIEAFETYDNMYSVLTTMNRFLKVVEGKREIDETIIKLLQSNAEFLRKSITHIDRTLLDSINNK